MANFNTASLKMSNEHGTPLGLHGSQDFNADLDNIGILGKSQSQVQSLGSVNQGRLNEFNQLAFKYPGFVGWRIATVDESGNKLSQNIPYLVFKQHMEASLRMGLISVIGPWTKPYERDEDRHAIAFGMVTYGLNSGISQNILGSGAGLLSGLGSYLMENRRHINLR
jgi:hypothetical protein